MEETALLAQLQLKTPKTVVFTGAQFHADHATSDGPNNLAAAIQLAAVRDRAEGRVLISFGGRTLEA